MAEKKKITPKKILSKTGHGLVMTSLALGAIIICVPVGIPIVVYYGSVFLKDTLMDECNEFLTRRRHARLKLPDLTKERLLRRRRLSLDEFVPAEPSGAHLMRRKRKPPRVADQAASLLLCRLPLDLRWMVWDLVIGHHEVSILSERRLWSEPSQRPRNWTAIARTCRLA